MLEEKGSKQGLVWLFFSREGRINRKKYIISYILFILIAIVLIKIWQYVYIDYNRASLYITGGEFHDHLLINLLFIPLFYMGLNLQLKRFNDFDNNGFILYIYYIMSLLLIFLYNYPDISVVLNFVILIIGIVIFFMTFFIKGTEGENKYGPDPLKQIGEEKWKKY